MPMISYKGALYATLKLLDYRFEEMLDSIIENATAIKKQVQDRGGLAAAAKAGHMATVETQLNEIGQTARVLARRLPKG